jgi:hypothetical protein
VPEVGLAAGKRTNKPSQQYERSASVLAGLAHFPKKLPSVDVYSATSQVTWKRAAPGI